MNDGFEKDFEDFYGGLYNLRALVQHQEDSRFLQVFSELKRSSKFEAWCEELPENSPSLVIPFSLSLTFFMYFVLVLEILYHKVRSYKSD